MKRILLVISLSYSWLFASELLGIDTLFGQQKGLRSITTIGILNTGNANSYAVLPTLTLRNENENLNDTKQLFAQQNLTYSVSSNIDIFGVIAGSAVREEIIDSNDNFVGKRYYQLDSVWFGASYTMPSIFDFSPQLSIQAALLQKERFENEKKNFVFQSYLANFAVRTYSDPVVYSFYIEAGYNAKRKFNAGTLKYGDILGFGLELSMILSPKISFDVDLQQRYQLQTKANGEQVSGIYAMPSITLGATYSFDANTAVLASNQIGGSSSAPDSIFMISLWKKF